MRKILKPMIVVAGLLTVVACQNSNSDSGQFASKGQTKKVASAAVFKNFAAGKTSANPAVNYEEFVTKLGDVSLEAHYAYLLDNTTNDTEQLGDSVFEGVRDTLVEKEESMLNFASQNNDFNGYWDSIGFDPMADVDQASFEEGLASIDRIYSAIKSGSEDYEISADDRLGAARVQVILAYNQKVIETPTTKVMGLGLQAAAVAAANPDTVKSVGDAASAVAQGVGTGINSAAQGVAAVVTAANPPSSSNGTCVGNGSIGVAGNGTVVGSQTVTAVFSGQAPSGDAAHACPASVAAANPNTRTNNNAVGGNGSIVLTGNGVKLP